MVVTLTYLLTQSLAVLFIVFDCVVVCKQSCVEVDCSRVERLLNDVANYLCVKTAMKSTMPFVDRADIEKVKLCGDELMIQGHG